MFGYIKPLKPEMLVKEFDTYQAVYCGLCHQLGKAFGPFAKLTLSYDFTFLALAALGLREEPCAFGKARCMANPLKKKGCAVPCADLSFVSACAMILFYHKVQDNIRDSRGIKKLPYYLLRPFASGPRKKARKQFPEVDAAFSQMMERQFALEQDGDAGIDRSAEPTAAAMAQVVQMLSKDPVEQRILSRFGYLLGRWIYLIDALDDLESDWKRKSYNPFLKQLEIESPDKEDFHRLRERGQGILNITIAEMAAAYELLEWKRYKSILDNIVYLGLPKSTADVLNRKEKTLGKSSLPAT